MLLSLLLVSIAPEVLDVDPLHGPYFEIRDAVAAAVDGDIIRVAPGAYGHFSVVAKSLVITGTGPLFGVNVHDAVHIRDLAAGQAVVLDRIVVREPSAQSARAEFVVEDCAGSVRVQSCFLYSGMTTTARVLNSTDVTFAQTAITVADNHYGSVALAASDSGIALWSSTLYGGAAWFPTLPGAPALLAVRTDLLVIGGDIQGGTGGPDEREFFFGQCVHGGTGGAALDLRSSTLRELGGNLRGGEGGPGSTCGLSGAPGVPIALNGSSTALRHPGLTPELTSPGLVVESAPFVLLASGDPTDTILLIVSSETSRAAVPGRIGDLCVGATSGRARRLLLGSGNVAAQLQAPTLPPLGVAHYYLQTVHLRGPELIYGPARSLTVLDSAW